MNRGGKENMLRVINTALSAAILLYCVSIEHRLTVLETTVLAKTPTAQTQGK